MSEQKFDWEKALIEQERREQYWGNDEAAEVLQNATPEQEAVPEKDAAPEMMEGEDEVKKTRFSNRTISRGKYFWIVGSCFMSLIIFHIVLSSLR